MGELDTMQPRGDLSVATTVSAAIAPLVCPKIKEVRHVYKKRELLSVGKKNKKN